jgi:hypothetical protein
MNPVTNASVGSEAVYNTGTATPYYNVKLVTVTVQPRSGARNNVLPGLRRTVQSAYVRYRNALN